MQDSGIPWSSAWLALIASRFLIEFGWLCALERLCALLYRHKHLSTDASTCRAYLLIQA